MPTRIDRLTEAQRARFEEWTDRWIAVGLRTGEADWERFEASAKKCYEYAGISWPGVVVRVPSPVVGAFAAPIASYVLRKLAVRDGAVGGAVRDAVRGAVDGAVGGAVRGARATRSPSDLSRRIIEAIPNLWYRLIGGQFWVGGWYWGSPSWVSFFRDVCDLDLGSEMNDRAQAYRDTAESACWWWPHKDFVIACDRPDLIARDDRGRLHSTTGPAIRFRDGWGVYSVHGVRVPGDIIEHHEALTPARIDKEQNAEIRRVMIDLYGTSKYLRDGRSEKLHTDEVGTLWRKPVPDDEPIVMVEVLNSTPEPDGSIKTYFLRVHPELRPMLGGERLGEPQELTARNAVASTFGMRGEQYQLAKET